MRSFAIYQIIATLAALALFSTTAEVSALPVRGALGNLNTRARIARRAAAANNAGATLGKRFKIATKQFDGSALPANPKQKLLKNVKAVESKVLHKKRDAGLVVDAVPSPVSSPASQTTGIAPGANGMVLGLTRPSVVVQQNIVAPAALAAQDSSSSSTDSDSSSSSSAEDSDSSSDQEAIYQSYIDGLNDSITATVTVTSTAVVDAQAAIVPTDFKVAAVVPVQSSAPTTPDAQAIYNSYVAQMNAAASAS
ncbi:hypothetical protein P389DRAFT_170384 [Cystobasidium minutum MCA 4210]|uniref:uncharacterized protein n=1 Tax=Cystobasidium minutum MCA 4210 TaxID=1397322 RepID=UPI0034CFD096|eukprot:jgi/Rhomi1/170384/fgenesh1_kg.4_\